MKLPVTSSGLKSIFLLAILFFGAGLVYMLDTKDFSLAPVYTDMIGTTTFDNIRVGARIDFFSDSVVLFLISISVAGLIQYGLSKIFKTKVIFDKISSLSVISTLFLLQQVLANEQKYFFIIFFGATISISILMARLRQFYFNKEIFAIITGFSLAVLISSLNWSIALLFAVELFLILIYKKTAKTFLTVEHRDFSKKRIYIFLIATGVVFISLFLLLQFRVDLFDMIYYMYKEKKVPTEWLLVFVLPLLAVIPTYLLIKRKNFATSVDVAGWFCFSVAFIISQFADNYLPVLLMMLAFLIRAVIIKKRKVVTYYLLAIDILISLSVFYLFNLFGFSLLIDLGKFLVPVLFILITFFREFFLNKTVTVRAYKYVIAIVSTPLLLFLSQELFMVLNQHHIFLGRWGYRLLLILAYVVILLSVFLWKPRYLKSVFSLIFAIGIAGIAIYNAYDTVWLGGVDFFEDASSAVAIKRIYINGELPLFEHFSPHNLNDFVAGLFYALLNSDLSMGFKIYGCIYALFFLLYYYLLSSLFKSRLLGFVWTLFSGVLWMMLPMYHAIAVLAFMNLYWYFKNEFTFLRLLVSSILILFTLFFRADTGVAIAASLIISLPFFITHYKQGMKKLQLLMISCGFLILLIISVVLFKLGYKESINNVQMILGYLDSAQSWGYSELSRIYNLKFRVHYFVFPVVVFIGLMYVLLKTWKRSGSLIFLYLCLIFFSVYYLVNFQRGLVRHSFFENRDLNLSSYVFFILSLLALLFFLKNGRQLKFMYIFLFCVSCTIWLFKFPHAFDNRSLYTAAIDKIRTNTRLSFLPEKIKRFDLKRNSLIAIGDYELFNYSKVDILRNVYKSREVWGDEFMGVKLDKRKRLFLHPSQINDSYFPDLSKLVEAGVIKDPVDEVCYRPMLNYFVSQKPLHFFNQGVHCYHTKELQDQYINDMISAKCNYVLVSNVSEGGHADCLDDVPHSIRHYYILQHIYTHYKPAVILDMKTLWVKDSVPINTKPLFQLTSAVSDSLYQFSKPLSVKGKKVLLTIFSHKDINGEAVLVNSKVSLRASFTNRQEHSAFVLVERDLDTISNILLPVTADSISIAAYDYFPDKFTGIPLSYNLKQLPYVLAQSPTFKKGGQPLMMDKKKAQSVEFFLNNELESKGCGLWLKLSNNAKADKPVVLQYYKGARFLGEYNFIGKPGKQIAYLLQVASQPNWNLLKPDKIKIITSSDLSVDGVHLITKDELSY